MTLAPVTTFIVQGGQLVRWLRDGTPGGGTAVRAPDAPTAATATPATSSTVTFAWNPPAFDGGSAITGYQLSLDGGPATTVLPSVRSFTFSGLTPATTHTATIAAANVIGIGPALSVTATTLAPAGQGARFPGDTRPLLTKQMLLGCDEHDHDPSVIKATAPFQEYFAPEATAGIPVSSMRLYYTSWSDFDKGGSARSDALRHLGKGRIPWPSMNPSNYAVQYAGTNDTVASNFIAWAEETATGPVMFTIDHESDANTKVPDKGTFAEWLAMQRWFRGLMNAYAKSKSGATPYKWKNLSFGPIFTAQGFAKGRVDLFITDQATERATFDWIGVDPYVLTTTMAGVTPNFIAAVAWCKSGGWPTAVGEYAAINSDPNGASKIQAMYDYCTNGSNDVFMVNYFNSQVDNPDWPIKDVAANGFMGRQFVAMMKNASTVHFWDLAAPDGTKYTRPAGV